MGIVIMNVTVTVTEAETVTVTVTVKEVAIEAETEIDQETIDFSIPNNVSGHFATNIRRHDDD
jgi:hypothetical protein